MHEEFESFSIYSLLEADGDQNNNAENQNTSSSDNFDIDTSLEDDDNNSGSDEDGQEQEAESDSSEDGEEAAGDEGDGSEDGAADAASSEPPEEPVEDNTDIFYALSVEEQQMKITMLKKQYQQLYSSCDELITRIDDLDTGEDNILVVSKLSETLSSLKKFILDYMTNIFAMKSFVENDIMLNRFLDIINTITLSFDKLEKKIAKDKKEEEKK